MCTREGSELWTKLLFYHETVFSLVSFFSRLSCCLNFAVSGNVLSSHQGSKCLQEAKRALERAPLLWKDRKSIFLLSSIINELCVKKSSKYVSLWILLQRKEKRKLKSKVIDRKDNTTKSKSFNSKWYKVRVEISVSIEIRMKILSECNVSCYH